MITKNQINERKQLEMLTIEQLVSQDHQVRKLDAYPLVEDLYSTIGRPSIDKDDIHSVYLRHPLHAPDNQGN